MGKETGESAQEDRPKDLGQVEEAGGRQAVFAPKKVKEPGHESRREMIQPLHKMEVSPGVRGQKPHSA